jgi:hypothetical protein
MNWRRRELGRVDSLWPVEAVSEGTEDPRKRAPVHVVASVRSFEKAPDLPIDPG